MFVNKLFTYLSKSKICFNVKSSTCYFQMKTKISADFQIYISVPLIEIPIKVEILRYLVKGLFSNFPRSLSEVIPEAAVQRCS